jgi:Ca-activated chloride channel homolog
MTRLAQRSDGNTYFVASARDLPGIFNAELGDVLNVVARRVYVAIEFPDGVRPLAFVGREGTIRSGRAEFTLNQLYGGQERFALIEVEVSGDAGAERELARAEARFEDAFTQRTATVQASRMVSFSRDERTVVASADHRVQADYARNVIAEVKDAAVELVDSGRKNEAAQQLRDRVKALQEIGSSYGNREVLSVAGASAAEADKIEREGLAPAARKTYRAENAQTRSQQTTGAPK